MTLLIYLIIHIMCGLVAVYLAGVVDRHIGDTTAPYHALFFLGPLGLILALVVFILETRCTSLLTKIYKLGKKE